MDSVVLVIAAAFAAYYAVFRASLWLAFERRAQDRLLAWRLVSFTLLAFTAVLFCGSLYWLPELAVIPLGSASAALIRSATARDDSPGIDSSSLPDRLTLRPRDAGYTCAECTAPVPDAMDRCPCCFLRVPWEARAEEMLPIPAPGDSTGSESLPLPASIREKQTRPAPLEARRSS